MGLLRKNKDADPWQYLYAPKSSTITTSNGGLEQRYRRPLPFSSPSEIERQYEESFQWKLVVAVSPYLVLNGDALNTLLNDPLVSLEERSEELKTFTLKSSPDYPTQGIKQLHSYRKILFWMCALCLFVGLFLPGVVCEELAIEGPNDHNPEHRGCFVYSVTVFYGLVCLVFVVLFLSLELYHWKKGTKFIMRTFASVPPVKSYDFNACTGVFLREIDTDRTYTHSDTGRELVQVSKCYGCVDAYQNRVSGKYIYVRPTEDLWYDNSAYRLVSRIKTMNTNTTATTTTISGKDNSGISRR